MLNRKFVWGMNGEMYEVGSELLNGLLLIHARNRTRLFVQGSHYENGSLHWNNGVEYPEQTRFYRVGAAVLTDIELDLCPQWKNGAMSIGRKKYIDLKEGKVGTAVYG